MALFLVDVMTAKYVRIPMVVTHVHVIRFSIPLALVSVRTCEPIFTDFVLLILDNSTLCNFLNNDTCVVNNTTVVCLHGTINENNSCLSE